MPWRKTGKNTLTLSTESDKVNLFKVFARAEPGRGRFAGTYRPLQGCRGRFLSFRPLKKERCTMKTLMLGNEAVARGLYEAGCAVVSSYPGTPQHRDHRSHRQVPRGSTPSGAPNEKVAMETAFGASLAGKRSFCGMKHVGPQRSRRPAVHHRLYRCQRRHGHRRGGRRGHALLPERAGTPATTPRPPSCPCWSPADSAEGLAFAKLAYELSERFDTPVLLKMCTRGVPTPRAWWSRGSGWSPLRCPTRKRRPSTS